MDVAVALTSISKSLEILKTMRDFDKEFDAATYKMKIADLMVSVADAKIALIEAQEELAGKSEELAKIRSDFAIKVDCVKQNGYSHERNEEGKPSGRPFCPRCETMDGVMILLASTRAEHGVLKCPQCDKTFARVSVYSDRATA